MEGRLGEKGLPEGRKVHPGRKYGRRRRSGVDVGCWVLEVATRRDIKEREIRLLAPRKIVVDVSEGE